MTEKRIVIGCGIFEDEFKAVIEGENRYDLEIHWLPSGYHVRTDWLADKITKSLAGNVQWGKRNLRLLYGSSCLLDLCE